MEVAADASTDTVYASPQLPSSLSTVSPQLPSSMSTAASLWTPGCCSMPSSQAADDGCATRIAMDDFLVQAGYSPSKKVLTVPWDNASDRTQKDYIRKANQVSSWLFPYSRVRIIHVLLENPWLFQLFNPLSCLRL